ncbi:MAG: MarR family transcriptional regulator [Cytophagales bacterium]|nr:MarR family transcriptional regulator [Cytophagales bacterium]
MEQLRLDNQICFPFYAISRLITRAYQPFLDELGITYPQYLVLMVLWEKDLMTVNDIAERLILNTNTVTPLLKRMESLGLISRTKSSQDERKVIIGLTEKGHELKTKAAYIPESLIKGFQTENFDPNQLIEFRSQLHGIISSLKPLDEGNES